MDFFFHLVLVVGFCVGFPEALVECFGADAEEESHVGGFEKFLGVPGGQCDGLGQEGVLCV